MGWRPVRAALVAGLLALNLIPWSGAPAEASAPLTITTVASSLPAAVVGQFYSQTLQATGGTGTYTWSIISNVLPPGLSLSAGGVISGTPPRTDCCGAVGSVIQVQDQSSPPQTATIDLLLSVVGTQVNSVTASVYGSMAGEPSATYTVGFTTSATGSLASGDSIMLAGPGGTSFSTQASDYRVQAGGSPVGVAGVGAFGTRVTITLGGPIAASTPVTLTAANTANAIVPGSYSLQVSTSGDQQAASSSTFSLTAPVLPSALARSSLYASPSAVVFSESSAPTSLTVYAQVYLQDASGAPVAGKTVSLRIQGPQDGGPGWYVNGSSSAVTDGSGSVSFPVECSPSVYCVPGPLYLTAYDATDATVIGDAAVPIYGYDISFGGQDYSGGTASLTGSGLPPSQSLGATFNGNPLTLSGTCATDSNGNLGRGGSCTFTVPPGATGASYPVVLTAGGSQFPATFTLAPPPAPSGTPTAIAATAGSPQGAAAGTAFGTALAAKVTGAGGAGVSGVSVSFTVQPAGGAGATFAGGATTATVQTDGSGVATAPTLTAGTTAGSFTVTASAPGVGSASFALTVTAGAAASMQVTQGDEQAAVTGAAFPLPLAVEVQDAYGNPVSGAAVTFTPAVAGAGTTQPPTTAQTLANGVAQVSLTAGGTLGQFQVDATTPGVTAPAVFHLTTASTLLSACDAATLTAALAGSGPVWVLFPANCTLSLTQQIVIQAGQNVTLDGTGSAVNLAASGVRAFDVEGGSLTLINLTVAGAPVAGQGGQQGQSGTPGTDAGFTPGVSGGAGGAGGAGTAGADAQGGAMYIAPAGTVSLVAVTFSGASVQGGAGGRGGNGGSGGGGGGGSQGASSNGITAAGDGGDGGWAGAGGDGGNAQGGAIYNAGTLTVTGGTFVGDAAVGGPGGAGGSGGSGGSGGQGIPGPKGPSGNDETCMPGTGGGLGQVGGPGGNAGSAGPAGPGGSGGNGQGGAIYNAGTLTVSGTNFVADSAQGGPGGPGLADGAAGGIGGTGGTGGAGGQGGAFVVPTAGCPVGTKAAPGGGPGGNGGTGGISGASGNGSEGSAGGPGGAAQGGAIFNAGTLTIDGAIFGYGNEGNRAQGGAGGGGGAGGDAAAGPQANGGRPGNGGCFKYITQYPKYVLQPPCGAPGKAGKWGYGKRYGLGGLGGSGGAGGTAEGGAIYTTSGSTVALSGVTYGANNGNSLAANLVIGGQGGGAGTGGYSKCALLQSGVFGCVVSTAGALGGGSTTVTGKRQPGGGTGANGAGAGADLFTAGAANSQLAIVTDSLPGGSVGGGYWGFVQATGGTTPYTWSVVQGSLPPGLTLNSAHGGLWGTATAAGTYLFTVQVQDSSTPALTATQPLSITVPAQAVYEAGSTASGSSNAASTAPGGSATAGGAGTATPDITASAQNGTGQVAVTEYNANPASGVSFQSTGEYFDVAVSAGSTFQSVTVQSCGVAGGDTVLWSPDGSSWEPVLPQGYANGCITLGPLGGSSSPTLAQLGGTPFAVAGAPSPLAAGDTLSFSPSPLAAAGSLAPGDTVDAAVYARTASGAPVSGATVYLSLAAGAAGAATADGTALGATPLAVTTDAAGAVPVVYAAGGATSGTDSLLAGSDGSASPAISAMASYAYAAPANPPATVSLQASPAQAAPAAAVTISGTVADGAGNPVSDALVDLTASAGTLDALSVATGGDGGFSATLTMPAVGAATVAAAVAGASPPVTAVAIVTPPGVSVTGSATGATTNGTASAGGLGATAETTAQASGGSGSVTVSEYSGNPGGAPTFMPSGAYFDVALSPGSSFTAVSIQQCGVPAGAELYWWNGSAWAPASDQTAAGACVTVAVNASTGPGLTDLGGTPFAVGTPESAASGSAAAGGQPAGLPATVGAAGGTLATPDGAFSLTLPPGALSGSATLSLSESPAPPSTELPPHTVAAGNAFTLTGAALSQPQPATLTYDASVLGGLSPDRLSVYLQGSNGAWSFLPTAVAAAAGTVTAAVAGPGTFVVLANTTRFSDLPASYWARADVDALLGAGVVAGFPDGTFQPDGTLTRAQFVKLLALTLRLGPGAGRAAFADVPAAAWFAPYVAAAVQAGIVQGLSPTRFGPDEPVTREEMAVLLSRALKLTGTAPVSFTDASAIAPWAAAGVQAAVAAGYIDGLPSGDFDPTAATTRAQAAKVLALVIRDAAP